MSACFFGAFLGFWLHHPGLLGAFCRTHIDAMPAKSDGKREAGKNKGIGGKNSTAEQEVAAGTGEKNYYQLLVRIYGGRKFPPPEEGAKAIALECRLKTAVWHEQNLSEWHHGGSREHENPHHCLMALFQSSALPSDFAHGQIVSACNSPLLCWPCIFFQSWKFRNHKSHVPALRMMHHTSSVAEAQAHVLCHANVGSTQRLSLRIPCRWYRRLRSTPNLYGNSAQSATNHWLPPKAPR